jgi:hypothetical protein
MNEFAHPSPRTPSVMPGLIALRASGSHLDGKRLHFATRQRHLRARCNSAAREAAKDAGGQAIAQALTVTYIIGVALALWGTLFGPFNALGWIAVGLNLLLGSGFAYSQFRKPRSASATLT